MFRKSLSKLRNNCSSKCILPTDPEIILNYELLHQALFWVINLFKKGNRSIEWIVLAEAPLSYDDYVYNPVNEKQTQFMSFNDVANPTKRCISNKMEMIKALVDYGILIIDIYPLALPTGCYKKPNFYDPNELNDYWVEIVKKIKPLINKKNVRVVLRYKRYQDKKYQGIKDVNKFISKINNSVPGCIGSDNMPLDKILFNKLFI